MTTTDTQVRDWETEFIEEAADLEHERWARWQYYLHSKCIWNNDGTLTIPAELVERWQRQIVTPYAELSESEKESDRKEARTYVPLIDKILKADRAYLAGEVKKMPSRCIRCEKIGVNPYGECICSYEDKGFIKKSDALAIINQ